MRTIGLLILACLPAGNVLADVRLDSNSDIRIREEGDFDTAAGWLTRMLEDNLLQILRKDRLRGTGPAVEIILRTEAPRWQQLPEHLRQRMTQRDAYTVAVRSRPTPSITISGTTPVATGYGILSFLEEELGMHWAFPGELGVCPPTLDSFSLGDKTRAVEPWVAARTISGLLPREEESARQATGERSGVLVEERGFFLASDYFRSLRLGGQSVSHNMIRVFPVEECLAEHPEVFPKQADGGRFVPQAKQPGAGSSKNAYQAWHPCYTEPATLSVAVAKGRAAFKEGRHVFSLGINDGRRFQCQCAACLEVGWPDSYYRFVTRVADALRAEYPAHMVGVLAYGDVGIPPSDLTLPSNVLVNIAGVRKSVWRDRTPNMGTYEYIYGVGFVIPNLPLDVMQQNFRYYQANRLKMYRAELYPVWAFDAPKAYIIRKMLWDPNQDVRVLLREYCDRSFGDAGCSMYDFYEHASSWRNADATQGEWVPMWGKIWPFREPLQFSRTPDGFHGVLSEHLSRAKACELTEIQRKRIEMVEAFTNFSSIYFQMWKLKERVLGGVLKEGDAAQARDLRATGAACVAEFQEHPEWFLGSSAKPDGFYAREWPISELEQQMSTVALTAAYLKDSRAGDVKSPRRGPVLFTPLGRDTHSWYKPWQSNRMVLGGRVDGGFSFRSQMNQVIRNDEDPRYDGELKFQWLHANSRNLDREDGSCWMATVIATGQRGMLKLELSSSARGSANGKTVHAESLLKFGDQGDTRTLRAVIDANTLADDGKAPKLQLQAIWKPLDSQSQLSGSASLVGIEIPGQ